MAEPVAPYVVVYSNDGTRLVRLDSTGPVVTFASPAIGDDGRSVIDSAGTVFLSLDRRIVGIDSSGATILDTLRPDPTVPSKPVQGHSLPPDFGRTAALLILPNGDLAVFVDNSVTSALVDVKSGGRLDTSYGYVEAAAVGADNLVYAVVVDTSDNSNRLALAQIDPASMRLLHLSDLGVSLNNHVLLGINVIARPDGTIYVYATQSPSNAQPSGGAVGLFWRFDPSTQSLNSVPIANDLGYIATAGIDGKIYFFAGTAGPSVATYDPAASKFSLPWATMSGPSGTLVRACFVL